MEAAELQQALVLSSLVGSARVASYCRFVQEARRLSQRLGVRGALLFDGEVALHLVEAPADALDRFIAALYADGSQQGVSVIERRPVPASQAALAPRWCAGYVEPQSLDPWCQPEAAHPGIDAFLALLAGVDCE